MNFTIFDLQNGSQKWCNLADLSRSLSLNCEIVRINGDHCEAVGFVGHKTLVFFAVEWADYALQNYANKEIVEVQTCISLVKKWIEDSNSVSSDQLEAAADAAYAAANAANAAYYAAEAAANAADAAANAAYYTARAAGYAAEAAANAINAAGNAAADVARKEEFERQGNFILKHFEVL